MKALRYILAPFTLIYALAIVIRNLGFKLGLLTSREIGVPVINIGNIAVGGSGKTPHVEYIIRLLSGKTDKKIATLSRGYGRDSSGFMISTSANTANEVGDEPLQYTLKYPNIMVAVDGDRVHGANKLIDEQHVDVILLDDAYQHRYIKPSLNILLTNYQKHYGHDYLLPLGNLREFRSAAQRADIIIVTKAPHSISPIDRRRIAQELGANTHQKVFYSFIQYNQLLAFNEKAKAHPVSLDQLKEHEVILVTGIANPEPLLEFLKPQTYKLEHVSFRDHHRYDAADIKKIKSYSKELDNPIIITTEKDAMRFKYPSVMEELSELAVYYVDIEVVFNEADKQAFDEIIIDHVQQD